MRSIRTKITLFIVCAIIVSMLIATAVAAFSISRLGTNSAYEILALLAESGEKNLDAHFDSVAQSVDVISEYANNDLTSINISEFSAHIERVSDLFKNIAKNTNDILTYYYRIDPNVPTDENGFWFVKGPDDIFYEHEVTDITLYDTESQDALVWFTVPKATGRAVWLEPYITENLGAYVISYNVPIYRGTTFIGVIGIEIDYHSIVHPVDNITLYENGYAFLNNDNGDIIYHPRMNIEDIQGENKPKVPEGLISDSELLEYRFEGVDRVAVWKRLNNGMRLNVSVPKTEIDNYWTHLINWLIVISLIVAGIFTFIARQFTKRITDPLEDLTEAAMQVNEGNYDVNLTYNDADEVGILTAEFKMLTGHLKTYIDDLSNMAYADALTSVHNRGAYDKYTQELQSLIDKGELKNFAVALFDCDDLKLINDTYGHDNGNIYLRSACRMICHVFLHSPVFRIGGDEFVAILQHDDYRRREELAEIFFKQSEAVTTLARNRWEHVSVSMGIADYDPAVDKTVLDVARRADRLMYENKRVRKNRMPNPLQNE